MTITAGTSLILLLSNLIVRGGPIIPPLLVETLPKKMQARVILCSKILTKQLFISSKKLCPGMVTE